MKHTMMFLAALTLGTASAQTETTTVTLPGTIPASVTRTQADALQKLLQGGGKVELLNGAGEVIGTLNPDGTIALVKGATLSDARTVQVTPAGEQGEATTYTLTRDLARPGAIKLEYTHNGHKLSLPLSAIVNRQTHRPAQPVEAPAPTRPEAGQPETEQPEAGKPEVEREGKAGKDVQPAKPEKAEKPAAPAHGKGKSK